MFTSFTGYADVLFHVIYNFTFKDKKLAENLTNLTDTP